MDLVERIRQLAAQGGDLTAARIGIDRILRDQVGYDIGAIATVDPATLLWTSCFVSGLPLDDDRHREKALFDIEFAGGDINDYADLASTGALVGRLYHATGGELQRSKRWRVLMAPQGCIDEMRVLLHSRGMAWGTLTLYRGEGRLPFDDHDEATLRAALGSIADLFRLTMLRAALEAPGSMDRPPGVVLVSPSGMVEATSEAAADWLNAIDDRARTPSAIRSVASAAAAGNGLARAALPTPDGHWVVLHGSHLSGQGDTVAVIVEGARPIVVSEVIAGAYGLTPREREITGLAALGHSTKQIALALGISPFTVQDHLKAVFGKIGVQSRAELIATIYVQHYEPRHDAGVTPSPYGWYLDDYIPVAV